MNFQSRIMQEHQMTDAPFPVYVGYDRREDAAYRVCRHSLETRSSVPLRIIPLVQDALRAEGLYTRNIDPLASTDFTYTRFFVPYLAGYEGWAMFCDCDFLWLADIAELIGQIDDRYAVMCVHHDHRPSEKHKMDGRKQTLYPRKNWSSMILYNCGHPANRALTPELANTETGKYLHRFAWLDDELIGEVSETWNWLEGWNETPDNGHPNVVHYTRGGPWFEDWQDVDFGDLWLKEEAELLAAS
jgi:lipopolysaccharide biosynthesis glycosyltransferase